MRVRQTPSDSPMKIERLVKTLVEQRRALVAAECDETLLEEYAALIRFLRSATANELRRIFPRTGLARNFEREVLEQAEVEIAGMSRADVERLINDDSTTRRELERIAIHRFQVPRGSMRSFSNRAMLVDKLSALLRNEQAHTAIETVARSQGELSGFRPRGKN
jgi:hypothetical protein